MKRNQVQQRKILENLEGVYGKQNLSIEDLIAKVKVQLGRISDLETNLGVVEVKLANLIQTLKDKGII